MKIGKTEYKKYVEKTDVKSNAAADCFWAFVTGGLICTLGQLLGNLYASLGAAEQSAKTMATVTLVFAAAVLTAIGIFDDIAKRAGAGTLVPITGLQTRWCLPQWSSKAMRVI